MGRLAGRALRQRPRRPHVPTRPDLPTELRERDLNSSTLHSHSRAIRTFVRWLHAEDYISEPINVDMPKVAQERLLVLSADEVEKLLSKGCQTPRDRAVVLLLVDTGLRRAEACALNWGDLSIESGIVRVRRGKGAKARSVVIGTKTRRALLHYRRKVPHDVGDPVIVSKRGGGRLTGHGLRSMLRRIGKRAGIKVTPHSLRRTFATLSLRAGMSPLHLQGLMGHESLEMTRRYVSMVEDDLQQAHKDHGPVDQWL